MFISLLCILAEIYTTYVADKTSAEHHSQVNESALEEVKLKVDTRAFKD